jgi:hypothetical protein
MPLTVKLITLWRAEVENRPGALAQTLAPFAAARTDLQVIMGYRYPSTGGKAAIEVYPITGKKLAAAATATGLSASTIPALLVQGDNQPALGHTIAQALSAAGINIGFLMAQVLGRRYSAVLGFETRDDAKKSARIIKQVTTRKAR